MNKKKIVVYTVLFGENLKLKKFPYKFKNVDYVCFTNNKFVKSNFWKIIYLKKYLNKISYNRYIKFSPHIFLKKYNKSIYVDANVVLLDSPIKLVDLYLEDQDIAIPEHRYRKKLKDEIIHVTKFFNIEKKLIAKIYNSKEKFMTENRVIMRNHNKKTIVRLMQEWWKMYQIGIFRDQLSLPYVCSLVKIRPFIIKKKFHHLNMYYVTEHGNSKFYKKLKYILKFGIIHLIIFYFFKIKHHLSNY